MIAISTLFSAASGRAVGLSLALLVGGAAASAAPALLGQQSGEAATAGDGCDDATLGVDADPWARTELFFGTARPDGSAVTDAEWNAFLDKEVTPRFPDGLTVLSGAGQWRGEDGKIVEEQSHMVILFFPREAAKESGQKIEAIRAAYEAAFQQESVLRADDAEPAPACVSF